MVLAPGQYVTRSADGLLELGGIVAHSGVPTPSGQAATTGLHGQNAYSYPEALIPLIAAAGIRWVRLDVQPGNGPGSLDGFVWDRGTVTPKAAANDEALYSLYAAHGIKAMLGVSDRRSLQQLRSYAAPGGIFSRLNWWPGIIESLNENSNFLVYPEGTARGPWDLRGSYAVGDVASGLREGGSWYCIAAHAASTANRMPDTLRGNGNLMAAPNPWWVPEWAYEQLWLNQQTSALRRATAGLTGTLIADGGNTNASFVSTLVFASESMGRNGSLSADLFNIHDYGNPAYRAVQGDSWLPRTAPLRPNATATGQIVLGETGVKCDINDYASGNNLLMAWFEAYRTGVYNKVFGYDIMDDAGSATVVPAGLDDYGLLTPTPGTKVPFLGRPADFPIEPKAGYPLVRNMLNALADPGPQPHPRMVAYHFVDSPLPPVQPLLRRNGEVDIPVFGAPAYGTVNSPPANDAPSTVVLDNFSARRFALYDPLRNVWASSNDLPGQTTWTLDPGINRYPRLLRITPG